MPHNPHTGTPNVKDLNALAQSPQKPQLYPTCHICGGTTTHSPNSPLLWRGAGGEAFNNEIRALIAQIYNNQRGVHYDPALLQATATEIMDGVMEGYGANIETDWDTPDHTMLSKLTADVWQFSSAKNYQQLREMTDALKDENGNLRSFSEFRDAVEAMNLKYNRDWLQTEYQSAIGAATSAARWADFQKEAMYMPMLQYQTVGDGNVRPDHQALEGTVKHINDPFWQTYYPPNGWNCRCEAIQLTDARAPEVDPQGVPVVPAMFRTNLAQNGLIFPKGHPYYRGVPKDVLRRSMQYIPPENAFMPVHTPHGVLQEHAMQQWEPEQMQNREVATELLKQGYKDVKLLPRLHESEKELREQIYGKTYQSKHKTACPDCIADGETIEFKSSRKNNMSKRIFEAAKKSNTAVLKCEENMTEEYLERFINGQWQKDDRKNLNRIIIINNGKTEIHDRPKPP